MQNNVDEIKSRLDIVDVISEYIHLKPAGTSFKALCPFHHEKSSSFFVSPEKQIWHCFGCGKGGDIFGFVQEIEGVDFPEALRILAQKAGVTIEKVDLHLVSQKTKILDICQLTSRYFHKILLESHAAEKARQYLEKRGMSKEIISEWQLGFAPDSWDTLLKFLTQRGFKEKDIEAAGLIIKSTKSPSTQAPMHLFYDRFRNRIMFPICDIHGRIVGFTGRIMPGAEKEEVAKYINSPETAVYNKSRILYGLDKAKQEIKLQNSVILVEGNMDVLACHQAGTKNVICTSGTALTQEQIKLIKRYTQNIILAYDVDLAGETATQRSIDPLLHEGLNVKVIVMPEGKDPDECIKKDVTIWQKAIENPLPIMDYYFFLAFRDKDLNKIDDKKQIANTLVPIIAKLGDPIEQDLWLKKLSGDLTLSESSLRDALKKIKMPILKEKFEPPAKVKVPQEQKIGEGLLGLILKYPSQGAKFAEQLILDMFVTPQSQELAKIVKNCYIKEQTIDIEKIRQGLKDKEMIYYCDFLPFLVEEEFKGYSLKEIEKELQHFFYLLKKRYLNKKFGEAAKSLKDVEKTGDKDKIKEATSQIVQLSRELVNCERLLKT